MLWQIAHNGIWSYTYLSLELVDFPTGLESEALDRRLSFAVSGTHLKLSLFPFSWLSFPAYLQQNMFCYIFLRDPLVYTPILWHSYICLLLFLHGFTSFAIHNSLTLPLSAQNLPFPENIPTIDSSPQTPRTDYTVCLLYTSDAADE